MDVMSNKCPIILNTSNFISTLRGAKHIFFKVGKGERCALTGVNFG